MALEIRDLVKEYPQRLGLFRRGPPKLANDHINLEVKEGEVYGFVGKNGAGKTTTIKIVLGLTLPTSGEIKVLGVPATQSGVRSRIGFAPERAGFYDHLTARETLMYLGRLSGMDRPALARRIPELLEMVALQGELNHYVNTFSKGMQQRLGLAQALLANPDLLIFDEPATGLDPFGRKLFKDLVLRLKTEKKTVFFSSHHLLDLQEVCDRVGIIHCGKMVKESPVSELVSTGRNLEQEFVEMLTELDRQAGRPVVID